MYIHTYLSGTLPPKTNWGEVRKRARTNIHTYPHKHTNTPTQTLSLSLSLSIYIYIYIYIYHAVRGGNLRHRRQTCATSRMRRKKRAARVSAPEAWRQGWREGAREAGTEIGIQRQRETHTERGQTRTLTCIPRVLRVLRFPVWYVPFPGRRVLISGSVPLCHRGRGATEKFKCPLAWRRDEPWVYITNII